jgi:hypothetical protein
MKKILFLLAALPALCFAQKNEIQHAAMPHLTNILV